MYTFVLGFTALCSSKDETAQEGHAIFHNVLPYSFVTLSDRFFERSVVLLGLWCCCVNICQPLHNLELTHQILFPSSSLLAWLLLPHQSAIFFDFVIFI